MELNIQDALKQLFAKHHWNNRIAQMRISMDWEKIMGTTINKYTDSIRLDKKVLIVKTEVPILKHEIIANKTQLISKINNFYNDKVVDDIRVI